ncbi:MAG: hypothetical protein JXA42_26575, partial [Anaerolineales bacterium]|nr:hypothetical protein [Anaerolineales bacterium]
PFDLSGIEITLELEEELLIMADPDQLIQVFNNVIQNGIQAIPSGSLPTHTGRLLIKTTREKPGWVKVSVSDNGIGIPQENLKKIFEPLFTTKAKGIGLGMAVVKTLVEGHGGFVRVESEIGQGSTLTVRLPVDDAADNERRVG